MAHFRDILTQFDMDSLPDLDTVTLGALELLAEEKVPALDFSHFKNPLVMGSGNAFLTAQIVFRGVEATFADESSYRMYLDRPSAFDGVVVFSASGKKHAVSMVQESQKAKLATCLVTNTASSEAAQTLSDTCVFVFPKNREPYTYNTSTYLTPIFGKTGENASEIQQFIGTEVSAKLLRNFADYDAYTLIIPSQFVHARAMLRTKFDELFGPMLTARVFTDEEIKHAKTVVESGSELFISFGVENQHYGLPKNRLHIPLPQGVEYGGFLAISYFVVGKIQAAYPPYFKRGIVPYTKLASSIFNQDIQPIVEA